MKKILTSILATSLFLPAAAGVIANFPMEISGNQIVETVKGGRYNVNGNIGPMQIPSPGGHAWRTDGYTSFIDARLGDILDGNQMSVTLRFAIDTHTIIEADSREANNVMASVATCLNDNSRSGFGFFLGRTGKFSFKVYVGGQLLELQGTSILPLWEWTTLTGTVDGTRVSLYLNGNLAATRNASSAGVKIKASQFLLGRGKGLDAQWAGARTADFNGAIDLIEIRDDATVPSHTPSFADLNLPADRYAGDNLRARFHGQPGMNWTNETHGLYYNPEDQKYHVFFQRTGSAPVMSHAHWGHIVSDNLFDWTDDKPAIHPSESYDLRGCWSGCLFTDPQITGNKPAILYTGVGYDGESYSALALCDDTRNLRKWIKQANNPIARYNNTARDTYFFRTDNDHAYFVIGDDGFLRQYRWNGSGWSDHGHFYDFQGGESGFTEMPNISRLPNGKWLMTFTPWTGSVKCIYRIGDIDANGKFTNFSSSELFDFYARDGFCLMSPSIGTDKNGNLIALGIVADKMATEWNLSHGYAHLYSLPRQLGTDTQGRLTQKPFEGHTAMRGAVSLKSSGVETLNGTKAMNPVRGRQAEVCAVFKVGDVPFGINFLKNSRGKGGKITYYPNSHELRLDIAGVVTNDFGFKDASYTLPVFPAKGEDFKMHLFIDHSICDLFINDRYATSFRVFPESMENDLIEIFSNGETRLNSFEAYMIRDGHTAGAPIEPVQPEIPESTGRVAFYAPYANASQMTEQEKGAADLFHRLFPTGSIIYNTPASIDPARFDCVWINSELDGIQQGWQNLSADLKSPGLIEALKAYVAGGGNLYLSKHAAQLVVAMGRTTDAPMEFGDTDPSKVFERSDIWQVNIAANGQDWSDHSIFYSLPWEERGYGKTIDLLGLGTKHYDRNVMWKLNDLGGHDAFCTHNEARVLGTWGHDGGQAWGGIIEFLPSGNRMMKISKDKADARKGTIIVNGLAAYHIKPLAGSTNPCQANIDRLTSNILSYLSPVSDGQGGDGIEDLDEEAGINGTRWFTLQGIEVEEPTEGIFICVRNGKASRVMVQQ